MPEKFHIQASDSTELTAYKWEETQKPDQKAIIQIAHGMAEHILRYDDFANFLTDNGFIVYGNNHRGHGPTAEIQGYFAEENGFEKVVDDMKQVTNHIEGTYPNVPIFLLGHSMGSFLTRRYIQKYNNSVAGVILSGTGNDQGLMGKIGLLIAKWSKSRNGATTPSPMLDKLVFGNFNKKFKPARTPFDFLTRDDAVVDKYIADEYCGFVCTNGFFVDLISGIDKIHQPAEMLKTPVHLPIYLIAGGQDPVGNYGKGVQQVCNEYKKRGMADVSITLYDGARHEILNETNKQEVYKDILHWLNNQLGGKYREAD